MKDQPYLVRTSEESTVSSSSVSEEDFNSEGAFCGTMSSGEQGPSEVEIVGMDLLLLDEQEESDSIDDSETDSNEEAFNEQLKHTVDSIELARKRLSEKPGKQGRHRRNSGGRRRVFFPNEEVDSLILARERLPHLIHDYQADDAAFLIKLFEEGRGLMGEVDSLELDRKRLPHLVHVRKNMNNGERIQLPLQWTWKDLSNSSDVESTSSDESSSSSGSYFTIETVDSLILARRRLASHPRRAYGGAKVGSVDVHQQSKPATGTTGETSKLPEKPGIGLGPGLCRQSSSACAA